MRRMRAGQPHGRAVAGRRRGVPAGSLDPELDAGRALLGHPDRGDRPLHSWEGVVRDGAALVEDEPRSYAAACQLVDGGHRRRARDLLVAAEREPDVLRRQVTALEEPLHRLADRGHAALVVEGAAPPDRAVDDLGSEGRVLPGCRVIDRYDVEVGHQHDRPVGGAPRPAEKQSMGAHPGQLEVLVQQGERRAQLGVEPVERSGVHPRGVAVGDAGDADQRLELRHRPVRAAGHVGGRVSADLRNSTCSSKRFSATASSDARWVTPDRGSTVWGRPAASRAEDRRRVWANDHVVVGQAVHDHQRSLQPGGVLQERAGAVDLRLVVRRAEEALGVVRVVERPVGHRRPGHGRVEHVRPPQYGERGEVAAEGPPLDRDPAQVELAREPVGDTREGVDLVLEHRSGQVVSDGPVPGGSPAGRASAVGDDHREALVGEPLVLQVGVAGRDHHPPLGPAVRAHQHRQRSGWPDLVAGQDDGRPDLTLAGPEQQRHRVQRRDVRARVEPGELGVGATDRP